MLSHLGGDGVETVDDSVVLGSLQILEGRLGNSLAPTVCCSTARILHGMFSVRQRLIGHQLLLLSRFPLRMLWETCVTLLMANSELQAEETPAPSQTNHSLPPDNKKKKQGYAKAVDPSRSPLLLCVLHLCKLMWGPSWSELQYLMEKEEIAVNNYELGAHIENTAKMFCSGSWGRSHQTWGPRQSHPGHGKWTRRQWDVEYIKEKVWLKCSRFCLAFSKERWCCHEVEYGAWVLQSVIDGGKRILSKKKRMTVTAANIKPDCYLSLFPRSAFPPFFSSLSSSSLPPPPSYHHLQCKCDKSSQTCNSGFHPTLQYEFRMPRPSPNLLMHVPSTLAGSWEKKMEPYQLL